jgi:glycosyltransferase involved in cell wall biosynthesis
MPNHEIRIVCGKSYPERPVKVSVLITSYNHERFIAQALDSAIMQETNFDYEIIVGEDCSNDRTRDVLVDYQRRYPEKMVLVLPERNLGRGGIELFRRIVPMSRGQFIAFLDGDDYWISPHKLQKQVDFMEQNPGIAMSIHNALCLYEDGSRETHELMPPGHKQILELEDVLKGDFGATNSHMYRRNVIMEMPDWIWAVQYTDWGIAVWAALNSTIGYIAEIMGVYRRHSGGVWTALGRIGQLKGSIAFYLQIEPHLGDRLRSLRRDEVARRYYELAIEYEVQDDLNNALDSLEKCLKTQAVWLQEVDPAVGDSGDKNREYLEKKLWFYKHPLIYRLHTLIREFENRLDLKIRLTFVLAWHVMSLLLGRSTGRLDAQPNPVKACEGQVGAVNISWNSRNTKELQIRVGGPTGPIFCSGGPSGSAFTGAWVRDRMRFYLQDVSKGKSINFVNTLDIVCVRVQPTGVPIKGRT